MNALPFMLALSAVTSGLAVADAGRAGDGSRTDQADHGRDTDDRARGDHGGRADNDAYRAERGDDRADRDERGADRADRGGGWASRGSDRARSADRRGRARHHAEAEPLTLADALASVAEENVDVMIARARAAAAIADGHATRARLLFGIRVSDQASLYHSTVKLSGPMFAAIPAATLSHFPTTLGANVLSVGAAQPLLGLVHQVHDTLAAYERADAGEADVRAALADARTAVKTHYLRLFEARALAETAAASAHDLDEQVGLTERKLAAGAMTTADVLRVKVAAANARQQVIAAEAQEATVRAMLLEMLGRGADADDVVFAPPSELQEVVPPADLAEVRATALSARPELASAELGARAAQHHAAARAWAFLPDLNLVGAYMKIDGTPWGTSGPRSVADIGAASVGLALSWDVWEWGGTYYAHAQAAAQARTAKLVLTRAQQQIGAEVAARRAEALAAASAVEVAEVQVASAEEAYRVMQALSHAGSATTTDLLDAEAALTSARMTHVRARYENAVATVALARATGSEG